MRPTVHAPLLLSLVLALGCAPSAAEIAKGASQDEPVLDDGPFDSARAPTDLGTLTFGRAERSELTASQRYLAWDFTLSDGAAVTLRTDVAMSGGAEVDTVLALYRQGPRGYGSAIASNDDGMGTLFSSLSRTLTAGNYRAVVRGYSTATRGAFSLTADCTGAGCGRARIECVFGDHFGDLAPRISNAVTSNYTTPDGIPALQTQQIIEAMHVARQPEVTTVEQALALTAMGSAPELGLSRAELYDTLGGRAYTSWRFVLGDHFWGAIFDQGTTHVVSPIVDDVFEGCVVGPEVCVLGTSYQTFSLLTVVSDATIRSATGLSTTRRAHIVRAVQETHSEVRTIAAALAAVDGGVVNERVRRDSVSGRTFTAYEYGAGDNSYGAIFEGAAADPVGSIHDGDMFGCTVLR